MEQVSCVKDTISCVKDTISTRFPNVSCAEIKAWIHVFSHTDLTDAQKEEILHYLTEEQIKQKTVSTQAEYDYLVTQYQSQYQSQYQINTTTRHILKNPQDTFGEKIANRPCPKCSSRDTTFFAIQNRSADEPTSYFFQCSNCQYSWKYR